MKKLFLTLMVACSSLAVSAQTYIGGEVGFWRNSDANKTSFVLHPEVGYSLSDKWALGVGFGYSHAYYSGIKVNAVQADPYARWNAVKFGPVSLFLDMGFGVNSYKVKDADDSQLGWRVGVQPGIKVSLAKNIDFVAHAGFLGYRDADDDYCSYGDNGFGFDVDGNDLSFGIYYNF